MQSEAAIVIGQRRLAIQLQLANCKHNEHGRHFAVTCSATNLIAGESSQGEAILMVLIIQRPQTRVVDVLVQTRM